MSAVATRTAMLATLRVATDKGRGEYDLPAAAQDAFQDILQEPRLVIPPAVKCAAASVHITGNAMPFLSHPFKITETISALKALESAFVVALCGQRYGRAPRPAPIDVENVGLFLLSPSIASLNGRPATDPFLPVRDCDIHDTFKHRYRQLCSAIFRTFDDRFFNLHGGVDARPVQNVVGVPPNRVELKDRETIVRFYAEGVGLCESEDLAEELDQKKLDGTIVYTEEEFQQSPKGKTTLQYPMYELARVPGPISPVAWPPRGDGVLSGIKVLEISRIIASPVLGRGLADHGATVLRIAPLADMTSVHLDLNAGKHVAVLNLDTPEGIARVMELARDADVVIDGMGLGIRDTVRAENPTVVWVRQNCYGFHGPRATRRGWGLADSITGVSHEFGRRLGLREPVLPVFPGSEIGAGVVGVIGVLHALYRRAIEGGGYTVDVSEVAFNAFMQSLGTYDDAVWSTVRPVSQLRHYWDSAARSAAVLPETVKRRPKPFQDDKWWIEMDAPRFNGRVRLVKPVVQVDGLVVGPRRAPVQNGDDAAEWP